MDGLSQHIHQLHREMVAERSRFEGLWTEVMQLMVPRKSEIQGQGDTYRESKRYDSTAMNGIERLAASIVSNLTPQTIDWFNLTLQTPQGVAHGPIDMWTQEITDIMHREIRSSNFTAEFEEMLLDEIPIGTGALFVDKRSDQDGGYRGLSFAAWHAAEYYITEGADGRVNRVHRMTKMSAEKIRDTFGEANLPDKVKKALADKQYLRTFNILQAIWKKGPNESLSKKTDRFPVASVVMELESKHILHVGGFHEFPVMVGRWRKYSSFAYGHGPGITALPDVQVLNEADKLGLQAWGNAILPPLLMVHEGVIGKPDLRAHRITTITEPGALDFLRIPSDVNTDLVRRQDKRQSIREIFFMDQLNYAQSAGKTPVTAAEIQARLGIMLQIMGTTLHRMEWEVIGPLLDRVFQILNREGQLPEPPPQVLDLVEGGLGRLSLTFTGPIARATMQTMGSAMDSFVMRVGQAMQIDQNVVKRLNAEQFLRHAAKIDGVPQSFFRTEEEFQELMAQEQEAQAALLEAQLQAQQPAQPGGMM